MVSLLDFITVFGGYDIINSFLSSKIKLTLFLYYIIAS